MAGIDRASPRSPPELAGAQRGRDPAQSRQAPAGTWAGAFLSPKKVALPSRPLLASVLRGLQRLAERALAALAPDGGVVRATFDVADDENLRKLLEDFRALEAATEFGTHHLALIEIVRSVLERIALASEAELNSIEAFVAELEGRQDIPRTAALVALVRAEIRRKRTGDLGGQGDLEFIQQLNTLLEGELLSGYQRLIVEQPQAAENVIALYDELRGLILLEGDVTALPATPREIFLSVGAAQATELASAIQQDIPGAELLTVSGGEPRLAQYHRQVATTQPYFAVVMHPSGIPLRMVIKDKTKRVLKDHVGHRLGNELFAAIHTPIAWVREGERYVYIREVRGNDIVDLLRELPEFDDELTRRFFSALGVAMSEAHVLGAEDRAGNLVVSMRRLREIPNDELALLHNRAVMNIDRENVLTPRYLARPAIEDVEEVSRVILALADFGLPQHRSIFQEHV